MKKAQNQSGFAVLEIIAIVAVVVLIGIAGWRYYENSNSRSTAKATPTPTLKATPTLNATPTPTKTLPSGTVVIKEWGVQGKPTNDLKLKYAILPESNGTTAGFSSVELEAQDPKCTAVSSMGGVIRRVKPGEYLGNGVMVDEYLSPPENRGKFSLRGGYYYVPIGPQAACQGESAAALQDQTIQAVQSFALSIKPID